MTARRAAIGPPLVPPPGPAQPAAAAPAPAPAAAGPGQTRAAAGPGRGAGTGGGALTVIYDERCAFCRRCRRWLADQPTHVPLRFLAAGSEAARLRYGHTGWLAEELAVVADDGRAWIGPDAFLVALWATRPYRAAALALRAPALRPMARHVFRQVSRRHHRPEGPIGWPAGAAGGCTDDACRW